MYKFARSDENTTLTQKILVAIILFHFTYTLTHNNKLTMDYFLFIFLTFKDDLPIKASKNEMDENRI